MRNVFFVVISLFTFSAHADEDFKAKDFVQANCTRCHDATVYTRPDRRITDVAGLKAQVQRCDNNVGTMLFEEDIDAVVVYLNETYYRFE